MPDPDATDRSAPASPLPSVTGEGEGRDERIGLREIVATAIFDEGWTFDGEHGTGSHARHMADCVLDALGLEQVGWQRIVFGDATDPVVGLDDDPVAEFPNGRYVPVYRLGVSR